MRHVTGALLAGAMMLTGGAFAQQQAGDRSSTLNNAANREQSAPASGDEQFEQTPGGKATPKSEWRTGDTRGKPQARRASKKHRHEPKKHKARIPPAESTGGER